MLLRRMYLAVALLSLAGIVPASAQAAFPGQNGKIAFTADRSGGSNFNVFAMNADGSAQVNLTNVANFHQRPSWSPDGQKIAYERESDDNSDDEIFVMNANGSGQTDLTTGSTADFAPAWSPDGQKVVFHGFRGADPEILVMNANGSAQTPLTSNDSFDTGPAWSPDGSKIAFSTGRDGNLEVYVMNADGTGQTNLTNSPNSDTSPNWSPDGQRIAFMSSRDGNQEIYVMNANGSTPTRLTNNAAVDDQPAWSPDGKKIAFETSRDGNDEIYVMNADGSGQVNLTNAAGNDEAPDWQPLPTAPTQGACGSQVQLGRATVEGALTETGPGTGVFRAGPGAVVYVGGFELRPRFGGELVVDTNTKELREEGTGVQVLFGRFEVPLSVASIPVNLPEASIPLNKDGTLLKALFSLPISGEVKAAWAEDGRSTKLELQLEAEKLVGNFGNFNAAGLTTPSLKLDAKQANCTGFDFTGAEVKADEISFIPTKLKVPKKLGLKNFLFRYEEKDGISFWTGQGELILPTGTGSLAIGGKGTIAGTKLGGVGVSASGINRNIGYGLFLQSIAGELAFEPDFGFDFGVGATLGPEVQGKKLVKLTGNLKGLALAEDDCKNGKDPIGLVATGSIPLVEDLNVGSVKIEGVNCIYTDSLAIEQSPKIEAVFGEVVNGEVPNPVVVAKANLSGFVGVDGLNAEGGGSVNVAGTGEISGQVLISSTGFAACAGIGFFAGGAAHVWGQNRTDAFTGCDLAPWRVTANASAFDAAASAARTVTVGANAPFTGFSARGRKGAPRVRVTGPKGERFTSRKGRAVVRRNVVMIPFAQERRTFVFLKNPSRGHWRVEALDGAKLTEVRTAKGLPKPEVLGEVTGTGATRTLAYFVRRIPGQKVTFLERTDDGIVKPIGTATRAAGRIAVSPASTGQPARIEAIVEQNGFPRDTIVVSRFSATTPAKAKPPARPRRVRASRRARGLVVKWARVGTAARYRVDVLRGRRRVARRTLPGTQVRVKRVPGVRLRVEVRAFSPAGATSKPRRVRVAAR